MNTNDTKTDIEALMRLTDDQYYDIACIIDNEFRGSRDTFTARKNKDYMYLTTNKCDWASLIRIYPDKITRLADDTESFDLIQPATMKRIEDYLQYINNQNKNKQ